MRFGKRNRLAAGVASVLCAVGILCMTGCSVRFGTTPKDSDIVAKPTSGNASGMEITYGEFNRQYQYYLKVYEIEDDTTSDNAESCKGRRADIINNLICDRIYLQKAKELGLTELSEEDKALVEEEFNSQMDVQVKYYGEKALNANRSDSSDPESSDGSSPDNSEASPSEEEIIAKGNEELDRLLADCNMTRDDLRTWLENLIISTNVLEESVKSITRADAEREFNEMVDEIKTLYNSNNRIMYYEYGYSDIWVPEGSRLIKHVLLGFDEETRTQITALRRDGKYDEADAFRSEKAAEFTDKIAEVEQKLDDGVDFNTILLYYSADAAGSSAYPDGYLVTPDDPNYAAEFAEAAFVPENIGDRTLCTSDFGVHIMIYADNAKPDEEYIESIISGIHGQLRSEAADTLIEQWKAEYNYEIDYEKLRIDPSADE